MLQINIRPINGNVIIEPEKAATQTAGGIILPDMGREAPVKGIVLRVDEGSKLKEGDEVIYKKWGGNEIELEKKTLGIDEQGTVKLVIIAEEDIIAVKDEP